MRLFFAVTLGMMLFSARGLAQEEDYVGTATSALQDVLSNLKQSVEKLSVDNEQWADRDNAVKQQISELQAQLERLQSQGDFLNRTAAQLQDKNPHRAQQIARLEKENFELDNRAQKNGDDIKTVQQALDAEYQENQRLTRELDGRSSSAPQVMFPAADRLQKEKLKLMKMIYDSQQRQESLHQAILKFQKTQPLPGVPAPQPQVTGAGVRQLEQELKAMEKNYSEFKDLTAQMNKKAGVNRMTLGQHAEEEKLQENMDDLDRQDVALRAQLDDLRSQMVDLDKRKSRLEVMIQQLP